MTLVKRGGMMVRKRENEGERGGTNLLGVVVNGTAGAGFLSLMLL